MFFCLSVSRLRFILIIIVVAAAVAISAAVVVAVVEAKSAKQLLSDLQRAHTTSQPDRERDSLPESMSERASDTQIQHTHTQMTRRRMFKHCHIPFIWNIQVGRSVTLRASQFVSLSPSLSARKIENKKSSHYKNI